MRLNIFTSSTMDERSKQIKRLLMLPLLLLIGCIHYYTPHFNLDATQEMRRNVVIINEIGELATSGEAKFEKKTRAIGFRLNDGYIVALSHATDMAAAYMTPFKSVNYSVSTSPSVDCPFNTDSYFFEAVDEKPITLVGRYEDISLFKASWEDDSPVIPLGNSDKLDNGTHVIMVGFSSAEAINIKDGVVSRKTVGEDYRVPMLKNTIMITTPMNPGDSGSPVIAFRNGQAEIVGIAAMTFPARQGFGFAFKSNYVKDVIEKIKAGEFRDNSEMDVVASAGFLAIAEKNDVFDLVNIITIHPKATYMDLPFMPGLFQIGIDQEVDISKFDYKWIWHKHYAAVVAYKQNGKVCSTGGLWLDVRYYKALSSSDGYSYVQWALIDEDGDGQVDKVEKSFRVFYEDGTMVGLRYPEGFIDQGWYEATKEEGQALYNKEVKFWIDKFK